MQPQAQYMVSLARFKPACAAAWGIQDIPDLCEGLLVRRRHFDPLFMDGLQRFAGQQTRAEQRRTFPLKGKNVTGLTFLQC